MEHSEKEKLRTALTVAFDKFINAFSAFDAAVVNTQPAPGRWTPAQVAWHIVLATDGVPDGNTRPADRPVDALLPGIRSWWEDLNQKFTSPEQLMPDNKPRTKEMLLSELTRVRAKDLEILNDKDLSHLCLEFELPMTGYLTRLEWLWFIEMHLKRHTFQLQQALNN
jgi:hypothetical protein